MKVATFSVDVYDQRESGRDVVSTGACAYYRLKLPIDELRRRGYDATFGLSMRVHPDDHLQVYDGQDWMDPDLVIMQRWMHRGGDEIIRRARSCGQVVLQDIDDFVWGIPKGHPAHEVIGKGNPDQNVDHYRETLKASDGIIVSTPFLEGYLRRLGPPIFLARNAVLIDEWQPIVQPQQFRVGWIGATPWRADDLTVLKGVLGPFLAEHRAEFVHLGHLTQVPELGWPVVPVNEQLGIPRSVLCELRPQCTIWDYAKRWQGISAVVVPLERLTFNEAKSWLRGLEACAAGVPFIATDLPEYKALGAGRMARSQRHWREHLTALLDPEVRSAEGAANRAHAEDLAIDVVWTNWANALAEFGVHAPAPTRAL